MNENIVLNILNGGHLTLSGIILKNYRKLGMNEDEFVLLLQIKFILENEHKIINFDNIATLMNKNSSQIYKMIHSLLEKGLLNLIPSVDKKGIHYDKYSLEPLYKKLIALENNNLKENKHFNSEYNKNNLFKEIEVEFGKTLSPIELEMVNSWFQKDHYSPEIVKLALKEAVLNNAYSLRYMDSVLLSWERKGIKTAYDVEKDHNQRRIKSKSKIGNKNKPKIPLIKWSRNSN